MAVRFTKKQLEGTNMGANLFNAEGQHVPEKSRAEKMRETRKKTNAFQKWVIDYLNNTGQFKAWRNNNIPSTRKSISKEWKHGTTRAGQIIEVEVEVEKIHFKAHQTDVSTFDVIGFRIKDGKHLEIEVKFGDDKLDKDQKLHMADLHKAGCISFVAKDQYTFVQQITPHMEEKYPF